MAIISPSSIDVDAALLAVAAWNNLQVPEALSKISIGGIWTEAVKSGAEMVLDEIKRGEQTSIWIDEGEKGPELNVSIGSIVISVTIEELLDVGLFDAPDELDDPKQMAEMFREVANRLAPP